MSFQREHYAGNYLINFHPQGHFETFDEIITRLAPGQQWIDKYLIDVRRTSPQLRFYQPEQLPCWRNMSLQLAKKQPGPEIHIQEGDMGDSWFLSALTTLSVGGRVEEIVNRYDEKHGVYEFQFYRWDPRTHQFVPIYVCVDRRVPYKEGQHTPSYCYSSLGELWPTLVEKAFAKAIRDWPAHPSSERNEAGYCALAGGLPALALVHLLGGSAACFWAPPTHVSYTREDVHDFASYCADVMERGSFLFLSFRSISNKTVGHKNNTRSVRGLTAGHAYTVLRLELFSCGNKRFQLMLLSPPWGADMDVDEDMVWNGNWSETSSLWRTYRDAAQICLGPYGGSYPQDGSFWISLTDALGALESFEICAPAEQPDTLALEPLCGGRSGAVTPSLAGSSSSTGRGKKKRRQQRDASTHNYTDEMDTSNFNHNSNRSSSQLVVYGDESVHDQEKSVLEYDLAGERAARRALEVELQQLKEDLRYSGLKVRASPTSPLSTSNYLVEDLLDSPIQVASARRDITTSTPTRYMMGLSGNSSTHSPTRRRASTPSARSTPNPTSPLRSPYRNTYGRAPVAGPYRGYESGQFAQRDPQLVRSASAGPPRRYPASFWGNPHSTAVQLQPPPVVISAHTPPPATPIPHMGTTMTYVETQPIVIEEEDEGPVVRSSLPPYYSSSHMDATAIDPCLSVYRADLLERPSAYIPRSTTTPTIDYPPTTGVQTTTRVINHHQQPHQRDPSSARYVSSQLNSTNAALPLRRYPTTREVYGGGHTMSEQHTTTTTAAAAGAASKGVTRYGVVRSANNGNVVSTPQQQIMRPPEATGTTGAAPTGSKPVMVVNNKLGGTPQQSTTTTTGKAATTAQSPKEEDGNNSVSLSQGKSGSDTEG